MSINISDKNISEFLQHPLSILSFTSPWCASCKRLYPHMESILEQYKDRVIIGSIDISRHPETPARMNVLSIPTIIFFKQGREISRLAGSISPKDITSAIEVLL